MTPELETAFGKAWLAMSRNEPGAKKINDDQARRELTENLAVEVLPFLSKKPILCATIVEAIGGDTQRVSAALQKLKRGGYAANFKMRGAYFWIRIKR